MHWITNFSEWLGTLWGKVIAGGVVFTLMGSKSFAQTTVPEPAQLGDVVFPIDLASIATAVATAGVTMIGLWAIYKIGFKLVRKFISRMGTAV